MRQQAEVRRTKPVARFLRSRRRHARYLSVLAVAALFVAAGTAFLLRVSGSTLTKTETVLDCRYDGHALGSLQNVSGNSPDYAESIQMRT